MLRTIESFQNSELLENVVPRISRTVIEKGLTR
jgi:hypothetical protein